MPIVFLSLVFLLIHFSDHVLFSTVWAGWLVGWLLCVSEIKRFLARSSGRRLLAISISIGIGIFI